MLVPHLWSWLLLFVAPVVFAASTTSTDAHSAGLSLVQSCDGEALYQAQYEITKVKRLLRRADSYKPSKETAHKKHMFAQRLKKWEHIARAAKQRCQARPRRKGAVIPVAPVATPQLPSPGESFSNGGRSKRGIGYNDAKLTSKLNIRWAYNWGKQPDGPLNDGVEFVAMLWGPSHAADWAEKANAALASGSKHLLAFNEPDLDTQANMAVSESVRAWKEHISPFAGRARLGSMSVTNGQEPMGPSYIKRFFDACPQCERECSFVALHIYDRANNIAYFKKHLQDAYALLKKPIWLTEFQGYGTVAEQQAFLREFIAWMEAPEQAYIERYAGFGDFVGNYVADKEGGLTPLGETYSNA